LLSTTPCNDGRNVFEANAKIRSGKKYEAFPKFQLPSAPPIARSWATVNCPRASAFQIHQFHEVLTKMPKTLAKTPRRHSTKKRNEVTPLRFWLPALPTGLIM
jgi:hypothetical protein